MLNVNFYFLTEVVVVVLFFPYGFYIYIKHVSKIKQLIIKQLIIKQIYIHINVTNNISNQM